METVRTVDKTYTLNKRAVIDVAGWMTRGVVSYLGGLVIIVFLLLALYDASGLRPRDSTDSPTERSGLRPRVDYGTGCQYLETGVGGITPRLDKTGKQICK